MISVIQIAQRSPSLLAICDPAWGTPDCIDSPEAIKNYQSHPGLLVQALEIYVWLNLQIGKGSPGSQPPPVLNSGKKAGYTSLLLKKQPCIFNISNFSNAYFWVQGPLCSQHSWAKFLSALLLQFSLRLGDRVDLDISLKDGHSMLLILSYHSRLPTAGRSFSGQDWEAHKSLDIVGLHHHMQICL